MDRNSKSLAPFVHGVLTTLGEASKLSSNLPIGAEYQYMATFPAYRTAMAKFGSRVLKLGQKLVDTQTAECGHDKPDLNSIKDVHDAEDQYELIADVVDTLVERVVRDLQMSHPHHTFFPSFLRSTTFPRVLHQSMDRPNLDVLALSSIKYGARGGRSRKSRMCSFDPGSVLLTPSLLSSRLLPPTSPSPFAPYDRPGCLFGQCERYCSRN